MSRRQNRASSPTPDRQRRLQHHGQQQAAAAAAGNEFMVQGRQLPLVPKGSKDHKSQQEVLQVPKALAPIKIKGSRDGHQLVQQNMFQGWNQSQLLAAYVEHMQQVNSPLAAVSSGAASPVYYYQGSPIGYAQHPLDWNGLQRQGSSAVGSPNRVNHLMQLLPQPRFHHPKLDGYVPLTPHSLLGSPGAVHHAMYAYHHPFSPVAGYYDQHGNVYPAHSHGGGLSHAGSWGAQQWQQGYPASQAPALAAHIIEAALQHSRAVDAASSAGQAPSGIASQISAASPESVHAVPSPSMQQMHNVQHSGSGIQVPCFNRYSGSPTPSWHLPCPSATVQQQQQQQQQQHIMQFGPQLYMAMGHHSYTSALHNPAYPLPTPLHRTASGTALKGPQYHHNRSGRHNSDQSRRLQRQSTALYQQLHWQQGIQSPTHVPISRTISSPIASSSSQRSHYHQMGQHHAHQPSRLAAMTHGTRSLPKGPAQHASTSADQSHQHATAKPAGYKQGATTKHGSNSTRTSTAGSGMLSKAPVQAREHQGGWSVRYGQREGYSRYRSSSSNGGVGHQDAAPMQRAGSGVTCGHSADHPDGSVWQSASRNVASSSGFAQAVQQKPQSDVRHGYRRTSRAGISNDHNGVVSSKPLKVRRRWEKPACLDSRASGPLTPSVVNMHNAGNGSPKVWRQRCTGNTSRPQQSQQERVLGRAGSAALAAGHDTNLPGMKPQPKQQVQHQSKHTQQGGQSSSSRRMSTPAQVKESVPAAVLKHLEKGHSSSFPAGAPRMQQPPVMLMSVQADRVAQPSGAGWSGGLDLNQAPLLLHK
eukprot:jgi/Chrzof1/13614/Cz08g04070.t1